LIAGLAMAELEDLTPEVTAMKKRWAAKWAPVAAYVCAIYLTLPYVRSFIRWLRDFGLGWIFTGGVPAVGAVAGALLLWRILSSPRPRRAMSIASLGAIAALYAFFMKTLATYPVERVHLIEYGLLGYMAGRRLSIPDRAPGWEMWLCGAAIAAAVGFVDEIIQGFIAERYYDNRDVMVNMASGVMGLGIVRILGPGRDWEVDKTSLRSTARRPGIMAGAVLAGVVAGMALVSRSPLDPSALAGAWARVNDSGTCECYLFDGHAWIEWVDGEGNRASGTYAFGGNLVDGPMLKLSFEDNCPPDGSGWQAGKKRNAYVRVKEYSWHFRRNAAAPFFKVAQFDGRHGPQASTRVVIEKEEHMYQNRYFGLDCCKEIL